MSIGLDLDRVPSMNIDAERAVLGAMMLGNESNQAIADVVAVLGINGAEQFYREAHIKIYRAIMGLFDAGQPSDLLTVVHALDGAGDLERIGGVLYVDEMIDSTPSAANVEYYAEMVRAEAQRRKAARISAQMYQDARDRTIPIDETIASAEAGLLSLNTMEDDESPEMSDVMVRTMRHLQRVHDNPGELLGLSTGFPKLDALTLGYVSGDLIIIAARPGMGKSTLMQNNIRHTCIDRPDPKGVLPFCLETSQISFAERMIADVANVDLQRLRSGCLVSEKWSDVHDAREVLSAAPIYPVSRFKESLSPRLMQSIIRRMKMKHEIDAVYVDHLQLMASDNRSENRTQDMSSITRELKRMAVEFDIPIIALSQLSRGPEGRPDKRPQLSDLRESGAIEQDADLVMFLYGDWYYDKSLKDMTTEVIIGKQRSGPKGVEKLGFDAAHMRFHELGVSEWR